MSRFFELADPAFDVTAPVVHEARERDWYVETSYGHAVLRYAEAAALLKDRRFRQGNARWPAQNGIHSGLFSDWWREVLLNLECDDHARLRRLPLLARRMPDAVPDGPGEWLPVSGNTGAARFPIRFSAGSVDC